MLFFFSLWGMEISVLGIKDAKRIELHLTVGINMLLGDLDQACQAKILLLQNSLMTILSISKEKKIRIKEC